MNTQKTQKTWEEERYALWKKRGLFQSNPNPNKKSYAIVMPPPNITGKPHLGHALNVTVQDIMVRQKRMQGREVCWTPGTDHASIATEAKIIAFLEKKGLHKEELGRDKFLQEVWNWKEKYETIIVHSFERLGISCDWDRKIFTMDKDPSEAVTKCFVDLHERGYIYRGKRMIYWDVARRTALSNEEVVYKEEMSKLYYIAYPIVGEQERVVVATTRPETILGDTALCVHPDDQRYQHLHGKQVIIPLIKRIIPVITDTYVDQSFGTGCLKITPAHDINDYELAKRHHLPLIEIFTDDGKINDQGMYAVGKDRMQARKIILQELDKQRYLTKEEDYKHTKGYSERSHTVVEYRLSTQWFVRMAELAKPAIESIQQGVISFHPAKFTNMYMAWMKNIRDWCISRQLWWGHRIPVYYLPDKTYVVAATREAALEKAQALDPTITLHDLKQDPDVLDTWFSSWLWPFSVFSGTTNPNNPDIRYYYPTQDLVTAPEIIFFWVARMIMAGYAFMNQPPFTDVYFTGIVRDKKKRKMSKSLGNSPDLLALIDTYGADAVRAGVLFAAPAGNDLLFDEKLCDQGSKFVHKMENALRLWQSWTVKRDTDVTQSQQVAIQWFEARVAQAIHEVHQLLDAYRFSHALITLYKLIWDDFCAHYLEMIKPQCNRIMSQSIYDRTRVFFEELMKLLHPFMPFTTEKIWQKLVPRQADQSIMIASYPQAHTYDSCILTHADYAFALLAKIRHIKKAYGSAANHLKLFVSDSPPKWVMLFKNYIHHRTNASIETISDAIHSGYDSFMIDNVTFFVAQQRKDKKALMHELADQQNFLTLVNKKLTNPQFVARAPQEVVTREAKKKRDIEERIRILEKQLNT